MCGITGVLNLTDGPPADDATLRAMLGMIRHRGPDEFGIYRDPHVAMGNARLSIIDLSGGQQPIGNEDETVWIVFNGEIFNHVELRPVLEARGHRFRTHSDTEVVLHLYEDHGPECLSHLNGQFAIAIWDSRRRSLFLARDRLGIRPLFYTQSGGRLVFGSEVKAILAHPDIHARIAPDVVAEVFTFWSAQSSHTIFEGIHSLPPAHYLLAREGDVAVRPYWRLDFPAEPAATATPQTYQEELESLLIDATLIRLRADVPVGAYLSGGLDSSLTTAIIRTHTRNRLDTFSIAFSDPAFDESDFQRHMAEFLGTDHRVVYCTHADIGRVFPEVIWHAETPTLRTAPAPMYLLAGLVHDHGLKVVLTGEGADEFLGGYDIFKEMAIRRFWARSPDSRCRPALLRRLYPEIGQLGGTGSAYLTAFFKRDLTETQSPFYSHIIRWANTARCQRFLLHRRDWAAQAEELVARPAGFANWSPLAQAQYLEVATFMSPYLLSTQGDRPAMAHSVEGRFPFLDYRLVEFCNRLPANVKLRGLSEKWLLRQLGRKYLPDAIWQRRKRPYRAPIHRCFFGQEAPEWVREVLSESALRESGLFHVGAVQQLARKAETGSHMGEVDDMALAGVLSTQLVYHQFAKDFRSRLTAVDRDARLKLVSR